MKISELIKDIDMSKPVGSSDIDITALVYDSRKACKGCLFVCLPGARADGHDFIPQVIEKGASAVVIEAGREVSVPSDVTVIEVPDCRMALARLSAAWFGHPSEEIPVIGITGTKGKTTCAYLIRSVLEEAGIHTGLIGTVEAIVGDEHIPASNTTPESYVVQQYLRRMIERGMKCCVMEVSSQALKMHRVGGMTFDTGVFTNLSPDHIGPDEHDSFEEYRECKRRLFDICRYAVVNGDDPAAEFMLSSFKGERAVTAIDKKEADLKAVDIQPLFEKGFLGVRFDIEGKCPLSVRLPLPGKFSVCNALSAAAVCEHMGVSPDVISSALSCATVRGRVEKVDVSPDFTVLIDYAHNAVSLESLLTTLRESRPERLICLFGCGGNRSRSRRFEMGEVSGRLADLTVITSDNPRFEKPEAILSDIVEGVGRTKGAFVMIPDRKKAIAYVLENGRKGDLIVLAGKGHETYQEIAGVKYPMDERQLIKDILDEHPLC